jgi:hypothetical protein
VNKSSTFGLFSSAFDFSHALSGMHDVDGAGGAGAGGPAEWHPAHSGLGNAPAAHAGFGSAPTPEGHEGLGDAPHTGLGDAGDTHPQTEHLTALRGYHPRVDVDGDGHWDHATYYAAPGGGAEIHVDLDHDGRDDFIGYDKGMDGRVDYADYDTNHDGVMDKRLIDDNGDGWLDRWVIPGS